ncbi:MAG TPA: amidohydrolase family protein [Candidatus Dormibacteraeota bacterium]|nr:amidohydrolase family protein [Candidatus Dormibacteraeota bacterium]
MRAQGLTAPTTVELEVPDGDDRDASGLILSPGWMDLHAHLRDPGFLEKETLATGTASAAFGGFTHVVAMANTNPVTDRAELVRNLVARAESLPVRVSFVGALTIGLEGKEPTDAVALRAAGAVALSDDGRHAMDKSTLRAAMQNAAKAGLPVLLHAQIEALGREPVAEVRAVADALELLAELPRARVHLQHVSTAPAIDLIRQAKRNNLWVTAEATPHHLTLTADDADRLGPQGNVNPPLRSATDRDALRQAVAEGVVDVIATDHAPHDAAAKAAGANGFHGFETAVGVVLSLGFDGRVLYRACVQRPRQIVGQPIDDEWILIDPELDWTVEPGSFRSRGKNTPFAGRRFRGRVVMTVCFGQVIFERMVQRV